MSDKAWSYCQAKGGKTVTVKIKYSDFTQATRSRTLVLPLSTGNTALIPNRVDHDLCAHLRIPMDLMLAG
jgi:nucleotidyltransferase/DNA polymerase involved in DNA repair